MVKAEEYDGTYDCVICSESVRGEPALRCAQCTANPVHVACVVGSIYTEACSVCKREMKPFRSSCHEAGTEARAPTLASEAHDKADGERGKKRQRERALPHQETCRQLGAMDPESQEKAIYTIQTTSSDQGCRSKGCHIDTIQMQCVDARQPCSRGLTPAENIPVIGVSPKGPARQCNVNIVERGPNK